MVDVTKVDETSWSAEHARAPTSGHAGACVVDSPGMTRRTLQYGCALCLLLGFPTRITLAQQVSGVVVDGEKSGGVDDIAVNVLLPNGQVVGAARTDEHGGFAIKLPKGGRYLLRALRMGYRPTELAFSTDDTTSVRVALVLNDAKSAAPYLMTPIVVRGRRVDLPTRLLEVFERAKHNHASIFTREDFAVTNQYRIVLQSIPSVHVNVRGKIVFTTCDRVQVFINGRRTGTAKDSPEDMLKLVAPADVALMEVYTHVTRLPVEYMEDACAVIAVWTK